MIATILGGIGFGLAWLNACAVRLPLDRWPPPVVLLLPVALPTLAWGGMCLWLIALMAADPTAANLWPLTVTLMAVLWLGWIGVVWIALGAAAVAAPGLSRHSDPRTAPPDGP